MGTDNGAGKGPAILPIEASPSSERTGLLGDETPYKVGMFRLAGRTSEECKDLKFAPEKDGAVPHTKWYMTSFLIAGEVTGAGLLALPAAAAKLASVGLSASWPYLHVRWPRATPDLRSHE